MLKRLRYFRIFRIAAIVFGIFTDLPALLRMVRSVLAGRYRNISTKSVLKILFALCYLFFFIDIIPDFIPFVGWVDDIVVIAWIINSLKEEITSFRTWETGK